MTAVEHYEKTWNSFLIYLNHYPNARLAPFCRERNVNSRSMHNWMISKGYSVRHAKQEARLVQAEEQKQAEEMLLNSGKMFLPVESTMGPTSHEEYMLSGINVTFPNGTMISIKKGCAKSVMQLMKLYEKEELLCLD